MRAIYNDNDPKAAAWLRELIADGLISPGVVDERSIADVKPEEVSGYKRVHFFAGIAGWDHALALAGWPAERPVWTGSCPCQPFSVAGKRKGEEDPRHLWPDFFRLIRECRPPVCFGEQVGSNDGYQWFARVRNDLEAEGYAVGCADLPACSEGAPHRRQRLFWVAYADGRDSGNGGLQRGGQHGQQPQNGCADSALANAVGRGRDGRTPSPGREEGRRDAVARAGEAGGLGDADDAEWRSGEGHGAQGAGTRGQAAERPPGGAGAVSRLGDAASGGRRIGGDAPLAGAGGHALGAGWSGYRIIPCRDGKIRRVESGTFPLAHGVPGRMGMLWGYGNVIVPQVAAAFVRAFMEATNIR